MKSIFIACFICVIITACSNHKTPSTINAATPDTTSFYPIATYFSGQLNHFDSSKAKYSLVTTEGAKKDSILVTSAAIQEIIRSFIAADISDSAQKKNYKESVFRDAGTASFNINYTPINNSVPIRNIDILMDEQTSLIKRIFIRKQYLVADTTVTEQLSWKTNEGFSKSTSKETNTGLSLNKTIAVRVILP